jgi:flagellar biosynthetic protein FlhB
MMGTPLIGALVELLRGSLSQPGWVTLDRGLVLQQSWHLGKWLLVTVLPVLLVMMGSALASNLMQVGFLLSPEALQPKLGRLDPLQGAKRIISMQALVKLAVSLGKLALLVGIAGMFIATALPSLLPLSAADPSRIMGAIRANVGTLAFQLAVALIVLALCDYLYQRWKHEKDLRMTKQEIRDEMKQMDGDPHIRARRREAHRKLTQSRELHAVKQADVVITNPTHYAIAIQYDPKKMPAPVVVAKGADLLAARIREMAREHNIPIIERKELARALYRDVKVGHAIPVEMYEVFVEIMAYVYRLTGRQPGAR